VSNSRPTAYDEFVEDPRRHLLILQEKLVLDVTERIYELMEEQGLSKAGFARRLGVTRAAITKALDGSTSMKLGTVAAYFLALGHEVCFSTRPTTSRKASRKAQPTSRKPRPTSRRGVK
jgi:hypothetical protein